jgi:hypothetical protein
MIGPEGPRWLFTLAVTACALLWLAARPRRPRGEGGTYPSAMVWTGLALSAALAAAGPLRTLMLEFSPLSLSTRDRGYHALLHTMPIVALLPLAMLLPPAPRRPHVTFLSWTAGLFVAITAATSPVPGGLQWGPRLLLPVAPLIVLALAASVVGRRRAAGARSAFAALVLSLALGLVMQGVGLRFLVAVRTYNAGMLERVRRTVPAGDAILSDFFAVPQLLASLSPVTPVLYVKPDADLEALSSRFDAANVTPYWIMKDKPAGGNAMDLGAGLSLVRYEREAGVRGFLRPPRGD